MKVPRIVRELKERAHCHQLKDTLPPQPVERSASNGLGREEKGPKFVVGKIPGAPENVNLFHRVKTLNSPK